MMKYSVLFVGMGSICRAPCAEGILRHLVKTAGLEEQISVSSAGTHDYHIGEPPDSRVQLLCRKRGYSLADIYARKVTVDDIRNHNLVLTMDWECKSILTQMSPKNQHSKLSLLMRYANDHEEAIVTDPYYGGLDSFTKMLDSLEDACQGVFDFVSKRVTNQHHNEMF